MPCNDCNGEGSIDGEIVRCTNCNKGVCVYCGNWCAMCKKPICVEHKDYKCKECGEYACDSCKMPNNLCRKHS